MSINSFYIAGSSHKKYKLTILFALSPLLFFAQSLTGLWIGSMSNDSTTVRKDQSFEIALTEYRGKVYGYSRTEFIVDDVLYFIVKRVKGTIDGDICEVTDDEIVSYNFPRKLDKNVKVISTFRKDKDDKAWHLDGKWKTNATKKYYSVSGNIELEQEKDLMASKIFPHLDELKLADDVAFYKERKEGQPIVKIARPEKVYNESLTKKEILSSESDIASIKNTAVVSLAEPTIITANPSVINVKDKPSVSKETLTLTEENNKETIIAKENPIELVKTDTPLRRTPVIEQKEIKPEPIAVSQKIVVAKNPDITLAKPVEKLIEAETIKTNAPIITKTAEEKKESIATVVAKPDVPVTKPAQTTTIKQPEVKTAAAAITKPETKNQETASTKIIKPTTTATTAIIIPEKKEEEEASVYTEIKRSRGDITLKAAVIDGRKSDFSQVVNFKSDSLQISLYDNGEIDGDTVSVFMNGEVLLSKQGLKASAIKKTIYLDPVQDDEFTLVMFAESLGKYPPNTGLLVIRDGDDVYNLRFSSDFQKNAGIVFRKKK
ncbi:MAG: hypothetical protein ABIU11_00160 [Chitinophagaceae bacterium]